MRSRDPDEQMARRYARAAALAVHEDGIPDLLRQRQTRFASAFARWTLKLSISARR